MSLAPSRRLPLVLGVVNVTPDSFSDGGRYYSPAAAIEHACRLAEAGADILDIGGESTRPGAEPTPPLEELERVLPVIEGVRQRLGAPLSIDTRHPATAEAAAALGAVIWNDVSALRGPGAIETAARLKLTVILMHSQGDPATMQVAPSYKDVVQEVAAFLRERCAAALAGGVPGERLWIDPGIGFGKALSHNLALLRATAGLRRELGKPICIGVSRKSFIARIEEAAAATPSEADARLGGSLAAALFAAAQGADMLRVHDVAETLQALRVQHALVG